MTSPQTLINELGELNCSQDRAREIMKIAIENDWQQVLNEAVYLFGDLLNDYEYWHTNDKF